MSAVAKREEALHTGLYNELKQKLGLKEKYENFIGGQWIAPAKGDYFDNPSPITGEVYCKIPRSTAEDVEKALDAAHAAKEKWGRTSPAERAAILNKIADRIEANLETLAQIESWDNGKAVRESMSADIPLMADHFRYFASCIRTQEGTISEIDESTVAYHFHEPMGVVAVIIPWNFPLLLAAWKLAPALACGNCVVVKPAEQTPVSILHFAELIQDLLPEGVLNVVNGFGLEAGKPLAQSSRINKITFTGETTTGKLIMQYASEKIIPVTLELGGKSPNIFMPDIFAEDDGLADKAIEGFTMFALNQGQVCTCPSRALVHKSIFDKFMDRAIDRVSKIKQGNPFDIETMMGPQTSQEQLEKILSYVEIGKKEGAELVAGGGRSQMEGDLSKGYYMQPTVFVGKNDMRIFQEEVFGPFVSVATFSDMDEALALANDTRYGLSGAVWTRDVNAAYKMARQVQAGRVWVNAYHLYPAHASFGGYKESGIGRETHKMMLEHYQQTKSIVFNYYEQPFGFY